VTFMEAIAREEGFDSPGTRSNRNNNPGDIEMGSLARAYGATRGDPRFAVFPTPDSGWEAMRALLGARYLGLTVAEALNKWAPPVENQTNAYIANVCAWSGLTPDTVLTSENIG